MSPSWKFWPFDYCREQGAVNAHDGDFDLVRLIGDLELTRVQTALLKRMVEQIQMTLWFSDDRNERKLKRGGPHMELIFFWEDMVISSIGLFPLLEAAIAERNQIGDNDEIAALEKIKTLCDRGIQDRKEEPIECAPSEQS